MPNPCTRSSPVVWVVSADETLWREAATALEALDAATVTFHWEELGAGRPARPDLLLLDVRGGVDPEKHREPLPAEGRYRAPRLLLCDEEEAAEEGLVAFPHDDVVAAPGGAVPWPRVCLRARRLLARAAELAALRTERDTAVCARELAGAASWSVDPDSGWVECSEEIASALDDAGPWRQGPEWERLLALLSPGARRHLTDTIGDVVRKGGTRVVEHAVRGPSGGTRTLLHRVRRLEEGSRRVVGAMLDVTDERESFRQLQKLAHFDALTGLVTRHHFLSRLSEALTQTGADAPLGLLYVDLDGLKNVNDRMGHRGGDLLLRYAAARLRRAVRDAPEVPNRVLEAERPILGRLGGDEFAVFLPGLDRDQAVSVAIRVVDSFREVFEVMGGRVAATASVGVAAAPGDAEAADELIRHADAAMYEAKNQGGDRSHLYEPSLARSRNRRRELRDHLRAAIERGELGVRYQPRVQLRSGRVAGAEALMRWTSPELGRVSPAEFIPVAEEAGLIGALGDLALEQACRDVHRFDEAGLDAIRLSVNVSGAQLMEPDYGPNLFCALQESGVDPSRIELEVTESVALFGLDSVAALLREVRTAGVHVALDDFGTGYSSLGVLLDLPLDCLKLDQSVIRDLHMNPDAASVVRAMIVMGHSLGLSVVGEGVSEPSQERLLRELDCDEMQGFLVAPAIAAEELIDLVRRRNRA